MQTLVRRRVRVYISNRLISRDREGLRMVVRLDRTYTDAYQL